MTRKWIEFTMLSRKDTYKKILSLPPEKQAKAAEIALKIYGPAPKTKRFQKYKFDPAQYIKHFLNWQPWDGTTGNPGQIQIIEAYVLALRQQLERRDYEKRKITKSQLKYWHPGEVIKNYIRVEAGHTTGKTKTESGLVNHFLDCFAPSTVMMYGPGYDSLKDNLWQELEVDRKFNKRLPGRMLDSMEIRIGPNHFAKARVASDAHGKGSERIQGKHGEYLMFILDEAEGIPNFVYAAIDSMTSGGIAIVIMVANPKTRTSKFHKIKGSSNVKSFRLSCLGHPNVIAGKEIVPHAVRRHYVEMMIDKHCTVVAEENEENLTFTLPYRVAHKKGFHKIGTIFKPEDEFMFRVMGVAPPNMSDKTVIPYGSYEAATKRIPAGEDPSIARMGIDVARWGADNGTLFTRWQDAIQRTAQFVKQDTDSYWQTTHDEALKLAQRGVTNLHIRIDGTGGFGAGLVDKLKKDDELIKAFAEFKVFEVHFGGSAYDKTKYYDVVTEMYFETKESIKGVCIVNPPDALEIDLTEREYEFRNVAGKTLKKLEDKDTFKKRTEESRSPDDGDGFVLAISPDYVFQRNTEINSPQSLDKLSNWLS